MEGKKKSEYKQSPGESRRPDSFNEDALQRFSRLRKKILKPGEYLQGILEGNRSIFSQAITLVESTNPAHQSVASRIIEGCLPYAGNSLRIGITGVPGVGKSTFIEVLGKKITSAGNKLAVLAIDPSSERSGGSILGDKTRMGDLAADPLSFIRPSPTGGAPGGVARKTRETIILCEAAGFSHIFIETVGVGQSETTVHSMVDCFLLLMLAGAGDELQGIKRGIMEMADIIAITKADGANLEKAEIARREYRNALHLYPPSPSGWEPRVLTCSAIDKTGIDDVWTTVREYIAFTRNTGYFGEKRNQQHKYWFQAFLQEMLKENFYTHPRVQKNLKALEKKVLDQQMTAFEAARKLLKQYLKPDR